MEIERKFKIKKLPDNLSEYPCYHIEQGYLCNDPTIRIRKKNDKYILTYKSREGFNDKDIAMCQEVELPLTKEAYLHLCEKTDNYMITKKRYLIPLDNDLTGELDIFEGNLFGLYFIEVEFESEEAAKAFIPPSWFGKDVSMKKEYRNSFLSTVDTVNELFDILD